MNKSVSEKILDLSPEELLKIKFINGKPRRRKIKEKWQKFTRDELIIFLKKHNIKKIKELMKVRRPSLDPNLCHYLNTFGKFSEAVKEAFGIIRELPPNNPEYIIKVILEFNITSHNNYMKLAKQYPKIIPSRKRFRKTFGGWKLAKFAAEQHSLIKMANKFLNLKRRLGRMPTIEDCEKDNVDITRLKRMFGKKSTMEEYFYKLDALSARDKK